jgi:hypothetical protein
MSLDSLEKLFLEELKPLSFSSDAKEKEARDRSRASSLTLPWLTSACAPHPEPAFRPPPTAMPPRP